MYTAQFLVSSLTASTLLHRLVLLSVCVIYPMFGCYSTNWDRKSWPGSKNQMYNSCPWNDYQKSLYFLFRSFMGFTVLKLALLFQWLCLTWDEFSVHSRVLSQRCLFCSKIRFCKIKHDFRTFLEFKTINYIHLKLMIII